MRKYVPSLPEHNRGKSPYGTDVVCFVGIEKFINCKRRDQIQETVLEQYFFSLSEGTVTNHGVEFLLRLNYYHNLKFQKLVDDIKKGGGYIIGIDGTGDGESDRLFQGMDLIRDWVLISERIPSESTENISPHLKGLIEQAGLPLAAVSDNGGGMRGALEDVMPEVPVRSCNYHFLDNVGDALMKDDYLELRQLIINNKIQPYLKSTRKNLYWEAKKQKIDIRKYIRMIRNKQVLQDVPASDIILCQAYDCISWILRYYEDNKGLRFPFSLPYLNLYNRCKNGYKSIFELREIAASALISPKYLRDLERTVKNLLFGMEDETNRLRVLADKLTITYSLFNELREILDIPKEKGDIPRDKLLIHSNEKIAKMKKNLSDFRERLREKSKDENNKAEKIIVGYLDKYWNDIILENAIVEINGEKKVIEIPRTTAGNDTCFGEIKGDIRKRLGKKNTGRELNRYGPYLGIVQNLKNEDYVKIMFGSWDDISKVLSEIPKDIIDQEKIKFKEMNKGYDITNNGIRSNHLKIDDIYVGIEFVKERAVEAIFKRTFYPPEIFGKKSNGFLTL